MVSPAASFAFERERMVEKLRNRGICSPDVLEAFRTVPREAFIASDLAQLAYGDHPLPIEAEQTISQPYIVALMIEAADLNRSDRVLEVGAGSGYAAAVLSRIVAHVTGIERQKLLVDSARERMTRLGCENVAIIHADGTRPQDGDVAFDAILVAASGSHVPQSLIRQLAPGGRLVMPIGEPGGSQVLVKVTKDGAGSLQQSDLANVRFVPLIGEEGWSDARA